VRLPRDLSDEESAALEPRLSGNATDRQSYSSDDHLGWRAPRHDRHHKSLRVGTLSAILRDVAEHLGIPRQTSVETPLRKADWPRPRPSDKDQIHY
jgi:hypothetical protein